MILVDSLGARLGEAGSNSLICICVVFAVLIFISLVISLFGIFPKIEAAKARKKALKEEEKRMSEDSINSVVNQIESKEIEEAKNAEENLVDDLELVAVIAAAIAASAGATSTDGFVVRSIRKVRR